MGPNTFSIIVFFLGIYVIGNLIIRIIQASKPTGGGKKIRQELKTMDESIRLLEDELEDAQERIIVLEKIVTDDKHELHRKINQLP